jgi:hypothetical protein
MLAIKTLENLEVSTLNRYKSNRHMNGLIDRGTGKATEDI